MEIIPGLTCLMESLDKLNRKAPGYEKEEHDDMTWTGLGGTGYSSPRQEELPWIRRADLENHNKVIYLDLEL